MGDAMAMNDLISGMGDSPASGNIRPVLATQKVIEKARGIGNIYEACGLLTSLDGMAITEQRKVVHGKAPMFTWEPCEYWEGIWINCVAEFPSLIDTDPLYQEIRRRFIDPYPKSSAVVFSAKEGLFLIHYTLVKKTSGATAGFLGFINLSKLSKL